MNAQIAISAYLWLEKFPWGLHDNVLCFLKEFLWQMFHLLASVQSIHGFPVSHCCFWLVWACSDKNKPHSRRHLVFQHVFSWLGLDIGHLPINNHTDPHAKPYPHHTTYHIVQRKKSYNFGHTITLVIHVCPILWPLGTSISAFPTPTLILVPPHRMTSLVTSTDGNMKVWKRSTLTPNPPSSCINSSCLSTAFKNERAMMAVTDCDLAQSNIIYIFWQ